MTRRLMAGLALIAALGLAPQGLASDAASPIGVWTTPEDGGQVRILACGANLCGRVVTSRQLRADPTLKDARNKDPALRGRPLKDLQLMSGFSGGPKVWKNGRIYRPQDGGTYSGRMELVDADRLKVTGCVAPGLCQSQMWTRVR